MKWMVVLVYVISFKDLPFLLPLLGAEILSWVVILSPVGIVASRKLVPEIPLRNIPINL